jgi:RNA polymerase sigma-70 factor (ECF subfamily)
MTGTDQEFLWVLRAQAGDAAALDDLLKALQAPLYHYLLSLVRDHHLALDVLQDVFVLVVRKLCWLNEPRAFRPWVYRIASREGLRRLKRERRLAEGVESGVVLDSVASMPPEEIVDPELIQRLPALLEQVSPASRAVLSLHYLQTMTLQEVADILDIPLGTAKARLAYGLASLRKRLRALLPPTDAMSGPASNPRGIGPLM